MNSMLVDFNNIAVSKLFSKNVMAKQGYDVSSVDYRIWEQEVFSSIYGYFRKFGKTNEVVLAIDSPKSWRKVFFPRYKAHRKKTRDKFNIDWAEYNQVFDNFVEDLKEYFPFKVIRTKYAEGDDVIGAIALNDKSKNYVIISSDHDYMQLCRKGVKLFSIKKQQEISHPNPEMFLKEASLIGQPKDNIFNVVTPTDWPVELRKPPFGKTKAEKFLIEGLDSALNKKLQYKRKFIDEDGETAVYNADIDLRDRYEFNRTLMDFSKIPKSVVDKVLQLYYNYEYPYPEKIYEYFKMKGWPYFLDNITNVENDLYKLYKSEGV